MRDAENQKIDAVTENKQMGRLTEEAHMDTILNPEPEPEKNGVSHSPKGTLKGLLEEADMEVTLKEVEKPKSDEFVQDNDEELVQLKVSHSHRPPSSSLVQVGAQVEA